MNKLATYHHEPSDNKKQVVKELVELISKHSSVGITNVEKISAKTIQHIRFALRKEATVKLAKNTLMRLAIKEAAKKDKTIEQLLDYISGSCAFLFTNSNPFKIANFLEKKKVPKPAKEGQIAPKDIIVTARDTGFAPGPVISELQSIGLQTRIEAGTVKIIQDSTVCRSGERVSKTMSSILTRLGIEPFDAGMSVNVIYSKGELLSHNALVIDFDEVRTNLIKAQQNALALAMETVIPIKESISLLLGKARMQGLSLALDSNFLTPDTAGNILAKTQLEALALAKSINKKDSTILSSDSSPSAKKTKKDK